MLCFAWGRQLTEHLFPAFLRDWILLFQLVQQLQGVGGGASCLAQVVLLFMACLAPRAPCSSCPSAGQSAPGDRLQSLGGALATGKAPLLFARDDVWEPTCPCKEGIGTQMTQSGIRSPLLVSRCPSESDPDRLFGSQVASQDAVDKAGEACKPSGTDGCG